MALKPYQEKILELMVQQELRVAEVYGLFAERVPQLRDFWLEIQREELEHAQWLEHLGQKARAGGTLFHEDKVRTYTIQAFLDYLAGVFAKAKNSALSPLEALAVAAGVEESLLERKVFEHFQQDSPELGATLEKLRSGTGEHAARIRSLMQQHRKA